VHRRSTSRSILRISSVNCSIIPSIVSRPGNRSPGTAPLTCRTKALDELPGSRVPKDSPRVEAYGTVDEANSAIGVVLAGDNVDPAIRECLTEVQHDLFELGGELCIPGHSAVTQEFVDRLERDLDDFNAELPRLKEFILPGGGPSAAACHVARTVVRRAERRVYTLSRTEDVRPEVVRYLNRLSDLLFVIARVVARAEHGTEILWNRHRD